MIVLSRIEEEKLLSDYSRIAWKLVHRFSDGRGSSIFSQEDLYQECMLVLVKHMNKCETKKELRFIQTMDLINAMTRFVLKNQVVRIDHNRTDQTKQILAGAAKKVALTCMEDALYHDFENELIEKITFDQFIDQKILRPLEKMTLLKMQEGYTVEEISRESGRSHQTVSYARKSAKKKYDEFVA